MVLSNKKKYQKLNIYDVGVMLMNCTSDYIDKINLYKQLYWWVNRVYIVML